MSAVAHIDEYKTGKFFGDEFRGSMSWNGYERNVLLRNDRLGDDRGLRFTDVAAAFGADDERDARGVATLDFDNDGDLDLAINNSPGDSGDPQRARPTLLRNDLGNGRPWLAVELIDGPGAQPAVGAQVTIEVSGVPGRQSRHLAIGSGYAAQQSSRLYFGLGSADSVENLAVRWSDGVEETFGPLPARRLIRIVRGRGLTEHDLPIATTDRTLSTTVLSNPATMDAKE